MSNKHKIIMYTIFGQTQTKKRIRKLIWLVQRNAIENGHNVALLKQLYFNSIETKRSKKKYIIKTVILLLGLAILSVNVTNYVLSIRCLLPSNFIVWEASRPLANCSYCANVTKPIILWNISRLDFNKYAYSSKPIIVKNVIKDWRATDKFSFQMFKQLYDQISGSYEIFEEGCQFLNFKSDVFTMREVLSMPEARARNDPGQKPWYVGWANCHPEILKILRLYYNIPDFFPEDAEFPANENIFFGYEIGAVMHLDYIPRLMWQGQVKGNKMWLIAPVSECDHICYHMEYYVEPGDVVLLDTRLWYHATRIPKGEFSVTVQSEYG